MKSSIPPPFTEEEDEGWEQFAKEVEDTLSDHKTSSYPSPSPSPSYVSFPPMLSDAKLEEEEDEDWVLLEAVDTKEGFENVHPSNINPPLHAHSIQAAILPKTRAAFSLGLRIARETGRFVCPTTRRVMVWMSEKIFPLVRILMKASNIGVEELLELKQSEAAEYLVSSCSGLGDELKKKVLEVLSKAPAFIFWTAVESTGFSLGLALQATANLLKMTPIRQSVEFGEAVGDHLVSS